MIHKVLQFTLHFAFLLRSSSVQEPRDPLLKVLNFNASQIQRQTGMCLTPEAPKQAFSLAQEVAVGRQRRRFCNDPSAGSPTETLLRLLLPLNDQV
jgi:hypothetical protein